MKLQGEREKALVC